MTQDGFRHYVNGFVDAGTPFIAYWYRSGFGLLKTGPFPASHNEYVVHFESGPDRRYKEYGKANNARMRNPGAWMETVAVDDPPRMTSPAKIRRWRAMIDRLARTTETVVVEYDGLDTLITSEGGFEL